MPPGVSEVALDAELEVVVGAERSQGIAGRLTRKRPELQLDQPLGADAAAGLDQPCTKVIGDAEIPVDNAMTIKEVLDLL